MSHGCKNSFNKRKKMTTMTKGKKKKMYLFESHGHKNSSSKRKNIMTIVKIEGEIKKADGCVTWTQK
jgi:hypothetical protein